MKTIEDVKAYIEKREKELNELYKKFNLETDFNRLKEIQMLKAEIIYGESQMEPTTPKPFDIDRCLNEDGGRCVWEGRQRILLSRVSDFKGNLITFNENHKSFEANSPANLQNIPRRKERWINVWDDSNGGVLCTANPFTSKNEALEARKVFQNHYIGDPICISSEEV